MRTALVEARLARFGVTPHIPSFAEVAQDFKRREAVAYCESKQCTRGTSPRVQKPYVSRNQTWCSCGSALVWKMELRTE